MINENKFAKDIAELEGGNLSVSIGQIKEILRLILEELAAYQPSEILALIEKHEERRP